MSDQAAELRQLVQKNLHDHTPKPMGEPQLVAVTSGKGGVGTTTVAVNAAVALAQLGQRVVLVDANLDRADTTALCRVENADCVADVLSGHRSVHEVLQRGPAGLQILPGPWARDAVADCSETSQHRLIKELKALGPHADVVILDVGSGLSRVVHHFWNAAQTVLLVTTPDSVAVMDTYAATKVMISQSENADVRCFVNHSTDAQCADDVYRRIARACSRFLGLEILSAGYLKTEPLIASAGGLRRPFLLTSPECAAAQQMERMARSLVPALSQRQSKRAAA